MFSSFLRFSLQVNVHPETDFFVRFNANRTVNRKHVLFYGGSFKHEAFDGERPVVELTWNKSVPDSDKSPSLQTRDLFPYGRFSACFKGPDTRAQPNAGVLSAFYLYNGMKEYADKDKNGIKDHAELDFEFLGAAPTAIYITSFIGYDVGGKQYEKITRKVDLAKGEYGKGDYVIKKNGQKEIRRPLEGQPPVPKIPGYRNYNYNVFGIDYQKKGTVFWYLHEGKRIPIFELPEKYSPYAPMFIMGCVTWVDGWAPSENRNATDMPDANLIDPTIKYEWIKYEPIVDYTNLAIFLGVLIPVTLYGIWLISYVLCDFCKKKKETSERQCDISLV